MKKEEQIELEEYIKSVTTKENKMKVNAKKLLKTLTTLSKGQESSMVGTGDSFIFHKNGIMVYSGDVAINTPFEPIGEFTIKGDKLMKFLAKSKDIDYTVVVDLEKGILELKDDNKVAEFAITEKSQFSTIMDNEPTLTYTEVAEDFGKALEFVKGTSLKNTTVDVYRVLEYIHVNKDIVESTDAVTISRIKLEQTKFEEPFLIKSDKLSKVKPVDINRVFVGESFIYLKTQEDVVYMLPTSNAQYLPTDNIIAKTEGADKIEVEFEPTLTDCLDRLIAVSENNYTPKMVLSEGKAVFTLESGTAKLKETIKTDYKGDSLSIKFDAKTLKNTLVNNIITICDKDNNGKMIRCDNGNKTYVLHVAQ